MFSRPSSSLYRGAAQGRYVCQACLRDVRVRRQLVANAQCLQLRSRSLQTTTTAEEVTPYRKQLKDEAKKKKLEGGPKASKKKSKTKDPRLEKWELTVGIEIHAELNTARKLFSSAATSSSDAPNTHVAVFDVAFPGTQPHFQRETLIPALRAAIALNCIIQPKSSFDRKHYFYQDQPAGYQITQYYEPFAKDGHITLFDHDGIAPEDGKSITIGIKQIQMEQDTAKTIQRPPSTHLLDFNRVSHPLIEVITLPHIHHPSTAAACVRKIQAILKTIDAVTAGMELGGLRADVNVSVRERHNTTGTGPDNSYYGVTGLGQRTEIKNLSSFKAVEDAIIAERDRQIDVLEAGGIIEGETRGWTLGSKETRKLRGKEGEIDYRYMPDPDLGPVIVGDDVVQALRDTLPELPDDIASKLVSSVKYGLTMKDAKTMVALDDGERLDYYLDVVQLLHKDLENDTALQGSIGRVAGNWVLHELGGLFTTSEEGWTDTKVMSQNLTSIISQLLRRQITGRTAKLLIATIFHGDQRTVNQIIEEENMTLRPMSREDYLATAKALLSENPDVVQAIKEKGQHGKIMFLVGQMVRRSEEGTVEAKTAESILKELLEIPRDE
ncbi:Asp-tRNAAsn/Glu-tRNAGln amidotransferase B subunit [Mytilinidion resinicola]|uniref:Glutamyl-tRNA(Gln) amidotransferase subunit B, mitochondrial n=1 Tax=Mytilinidion resinicola TaxID=574789 RepID=A0A6A6YGZ3_9PEZI|nr:Asp-tRNAAsn/Glu-tRNAGln amidotransferase B subunit [Mytilinidion resinicola]KAF2808086.1 Asp-tRNAAsn/Glu-tRNAGln amidotransferase B subunit [Mytilinidion resinicola]